MSKLRISHAWSSSCVERVDTVASPLVALQPDRSATADDFQTMSSQPGDTMTDEDQIRQALALWGQREADKDFKALSELFAEDGRYVRPEGDAWIGPAMILQKWEERYAKRSPTFHQ